MNLLLSLLGKYFIYNEASLKKLLLNFFPNYSIDQQVVMHMHLLKTF